MQPFVCGGMSAMLSSSCIHPIDLAKVRLQLYGVTPRYAFPSVGMLTSIVKADGITAIYAGLSAALMRQAVYGTARIGLHRYFSEQLVARNDGKPRFCGRCSLVCVVVPLR